MKNTALLLALLLLVSCMQKEKSSDFTERVLDLAIETRNGRYLELPDLYDGAVIGLPEEKDESLILVEKLKARGFKITDTKRDINGLSGKRSITVTVFDGTCHCDVTKTYSPSAFVSQFAVTEKITCH